MLGGMSISSYFGTIKEGEISVEGIGRILAYLALRSKRVVSSLQFARECARQP